MNTTVLATGLCGCGGIVARGVPSLSSSPTDGAARGRGKGWRLTTPAAMEYASREGMSKFLGQTGPSQSPLAQCRMDGANSMTQRGFGNGSSGGLGRRGGAHFLWMVPSVSAGDKAGFGHDDGGDYIGGNGGFGGGGGGGGRGDGPGDVPGGAGGAGQVFPHVGASLWVWYNTLLETHPLISKSVTAGVMNAVADLFCQLYIEKVDELDWKRFISFVSIGVFLSGPGLHFWYGALPKIVPMPGVGGVLLRIALDQFFFTPLGMVGFFVVLLTLEDRRANIRTKLEKDLWPTIVANWKVWIPFQVMNFGLIPPQLQVAATGLLGMGWSVFVSYKGHT
ncbi:unnamed protein product [Calypogeia fissa]